MAEIIIPSKHEHAPMDDVPEFVVMKILTYIPPHSYLPYAHVSKRFRSSWVEMKCTQSRLSSDDIADAYKTNPLSIGNLFPLSWNARPCRSTSIHSTDSGSGNSLNTALLKYYIQNGYGNLMNISSPKHGDEVRSEKMEAMKEDSDSNQGLKNDDTSSSSHRNSTILAKVMCETAMRGDIHGMNYMVVHKYSSLDNENVCTVAAAAGQLTTLRWLRGDIQTGGVMNLKNCPCPWDPTEIHREAAENAHDDVVGYVEQNSEGHNIQVHYGVGLPW